MVKIITHKFGEISIQVENEIKQLLKNSYEKLEPHDVQLLDLILFENSSDMESFFYKERKTLGIISEDLGDLFCATHDAWRGTPRISICLERMKKLPRIIQISALRHEVGHSILHGSIEYYVFPIPDILTEILKENKLSKDYLTNLAYLVSIAVKDFEVTKLLCNRGYEKEQIKYAKYLLKTSGEDLTAWELAKSNTYATAICLAGRLKDFVCLIALYPALDSESIKKIIGKELSYLPEQILERFMKFVLIFRESLNNDTLKNFNIAIEAFVRYLFVSFVDKKE
jgi:hypothetical protein